MCGIAGFFKANSESMGTELLCMTEALAHRGPDDAGFVLANTHRRSHQTFSSRRSPAAIQNAYPALSSADATTVCNLALAQVRFSIIDLSPSGHQPMWNRVGSACITFNGEIYNYLELKQELIALGHSFTSNSDTEVFLVGYQEWGDSVFERLNGFFAVCIFDKLLNKVLMARDRLGKADLYLFCKSGRELYWASEIKSLVSTGKVNTRSIDTESVADFLLNGRRDRRGTFWEEIIDFPPGHFAWIDDRCNLEPKRYWQLPTARLRSRDISIDEASEGLTERLTDALKIRLRADVPIGFELSGGLDSSSLVAIAAGRLNKKLMTYTVRFREEHSNEEPFAKLVAEKFGDAIDYHVIDPPDQEFWSECNSFVQLQDEPFHAPNLHTNQVVRRKFKEQGIQVVITGAAGDELLAGYPHMYFPPFLRYLMKSGSWATLFREIRKNTEMGALPALKSLVRDKLLSESTVMGLGKRKTGEWQVLKAILRADLLRFPQGPGFDDPASSFDDLTRSNMTNRMMNYWLRSSSKSNYGIPVEVRSPFLDYEVVEYCLRMPPEYLIRDGWHKYLLRHSMRALLPKQVLWRRNKMGFPFPYREWLTISKDLVLKNVKANYCPLMYSEPFVKHYDEMVKKYPVTLWRIISLHLWWQRVVENELILIN